MQKSNYIRIAKGLEALFGHSVEVVLHDLTENRIAYITESVCVRKAGDPSDILDSEIVGAGLIGPYQKTGEGGQPQRSVSTVLCNPNGDPDYMLCINFSNGDLLQAKSLLEGFLGTRQAEPMTRYFQENWQDKINQFIGEYIQKRQVSLGQLTRKDKKELIGQLKDHGAFNGKNAAQYIADSLKISRASVYGYMKQRDDHESK